MRIIYLTDVHGSFDEVKDLLLETVADVYIISGDLIDIPFYNVDTAIRYHELQSWFHGLRRQMNREDEVLEDFVEDLLSAPDSDEELQQKGMDYQSLTIRARRVMQQKYKVLENVMAYKTTAKIFAIPGNYDMDLKYTALHERDLHMHWHSLEALKIAGYGGAASWTAGIPERYIVQYRAGIGTDDRRNEMYSFLKAVKPHIIVTHQPAHGVHDWLSFKGPTGSPALRTYCDNNPVLLCLTGHIHEAFGFVSESGTVYLNPSNFGEVTTVSGDIREGGFFHQIDIDDGVIEHICFRKLVKNRIHDIADYIPEGDTWREEIVDQDRWDALKRGKNFDMEIKKYSHIREIELFNDLRGFFRLFQTKETEERIDMLEKVNKLLEGHFESVAMDVMGSVNVGLSQSESDIDMVLYLDCGRGCLDDMGTCENLGKIREMIAERLEGIYRFEIIDCVDLSVVTRAIEERDFESEMLQRFVAHRSMGRAVNYRVIAPVEDMLNNDIELRREIEGSIHAFFKIFVNTSQHVSSFEKYELRLKSLGIKIPEAIYNKIRDYLQTEEEE